MKELPADKPIEKDILKPSKMLFDKPQEKDNANDKPTTANESVYDAATGKYGVWIDGEFVIDANKRHGRVTLNSFKNDPNQSRDTQNSTFLIRI